MNASLLYCLQVNIAIVLFYLFYRLFFVRDTFWNIRRHYLLLSILISFMHPLLSVESWLEKPEPVQQLIVKSVTLPEIVVTSKQPVFALPNFSFENVILVVYGLVVMILLLRLLVQLFSIFRIRFQGEKQLVEGVNVIALDKEITPFSFFGWVFLNPALHNEEETRQILAHELAHARQHHSVDVLLIELLACVFWFNPAVWLLKREIRQNLEYLADNKVIKSGFDSRIYQYHLLQLSYQGPDLNLTNKFNISPLKKRITMMNQKKSNKAGLLKYSLVVPLALALVLTSNAQEVVVKAKQANVPTQQKVVEAKKMSAVNATGEKQVPERVGVQFTAPEKQVPLKSTKKFAAPVIYRDTTVYEKVEKMPEFPGGLNALMTYISQNMKYPALAQEKGIQGSVVVRFVVDAKGKIKKAEILRGVSPELDNEALRVVKSMPAWTPGEEKGKKVAVWYALPIKFRL